MTRRPALPFALAEARGRTSRSEKSRYAVALAVGATSFGNSLISAWQIPGVYPPVFLTAVLALLGTALVVGVIEVCCKRTARIGVWSFIGLSVLIVGCHRQTYLSPGSIDYPPLFHAVSVGFLLVAFVSSRTMTMLAMLVLVPWAFAVRLEVVGPMQAAVNALLWANFLPMVYVGSQLVGRAMADAAARAEVLATARHDELRAAQRVFEQERWNGLIHDKILGCLRLCFRESTGVPVPAPPRQLALQAIDILADIHSCADESVADQIGKLCGSLGLTATIDLHEHDPNPMVATAVLSAAESALNNVALHSGSPHVTIRGDLTSEQAGVGIADCGIGFDPGRVDPRSMGVSQGVVRRMQSVGGDAAVRSAPGHGTTIELWWQHTSPGPTVLAWHQRIFQHMVIFGTVMVLTQVGVGVFYLRSFDPEWISIVAMVLIPCAAWALVLLPMGRLWATTVVLTILIPWVLTFALRIPVPHDASTWFIVAAQAAVAVMSFRYQAWLGPAVVALQFAGMVTVFLVRGAVPWLPLVTSFAALALSAVAVAGSRIALDRETRRIVDDHEAQAAMTASLIAAEEQRRESTRRIAAIASTVQPLLILLTKPTTILTADLQERCRHVEASLRDQLVAGTVLDGDLVAAIAAARAGGASVEISAVGDTDPGLQHFRKVAGTVIRDARPGDHVQIRWRPHYPTQRLGSIAMIGERPGLDWPQIALPINTGITVSTSYDESSALLELERQTAQRQAEAAESLADAANFLPRA